MSDATPSGWDCHVHVFEAAAPVQPGHYRPADHPLSRLEAVAAADGVGHVVLVQPSVYGSDNSLMLRALAVQPGRHRGVAVIDDDTADAELDRLHEAGVRGVRLNLVSPVGERTDPAARFRALAPRLRERGWHLQWYARSSDLPAIAAMHEGSGVTGVLDHLGGLLAGTGESDPVWDTLSRLADGGAWIKLSGWYRLGDVAPYRGLWPSVAAVARRFGERMVWGSDWPHTSFRPGEAPDYASTWQPVVEVLGTEAARRLRERRPALYD